MGRTDEGVTETSVSMFSLSVAWLCQHFAVPWTETCQASLSFAISWSFLKLMSIESMMPSNHLILCCPLLLLPSVFPSIWVFSNELALHQVAKVLGVSASISALPMDIQYWFPLGWTSLICEYLFCTALTLKTMVRFHKLQKQIVNTNQDGGGGPKMKYK